MKRCQLYFMGILILFLSSCGIQSAKEKGIIETINKEMGINLQNNTRKGALEEFYEYTYYNEGHKEAKKIKGIIDKTINALPVSKKHGYNDDVHDIYKWETPQQEIKLKTGFKSDTPSPENYIVYVKIWIHNK